MTLALQDHAASEGRHFQRRQNFTPRSGHNYSSPVQQIFSYLGMQQQRRSGSRRNVNQKLDDTD